ncbi:MULTISPECIES: TRAM domain-containing protein [unclassified Brevibacterium]|uniref:class I SAM-dependent RNA methyltransferase n=1 Tax=unclassified Brevibacterium TaxID=2614124 RepID=UPI001E5A435E|nr:MULTISPECIES: TRAM domain-containing protein [unclassified Brevibacterium]MCD1285140.1 class I SAM-dependent RNA methyltransferase [Brevibacterium sp. CCUG 69071]MDK8435236.1 TRAM domain-containing protein [Brevibacterium sp. H-BE7]
MSTPELPAQELTLDIASPAAGGSSIARHDGQVVFVTGALPGERVRARTEAGPAAKFLRAEVTEVLEPSEFRVPDRRLDYLPESLRSGSQPDASPLLFGGMEYAHVELAHSRALKAEVIADQLSRIGHLDRSVEVHPAPGEEHTGRGTDWRTRVQLAVDEQGRLGMLAPRSHDVVPVNSAPLACPAIAEVDLSGLRLPGARRLEFAWAGDDGAVIVRGDCDPAAVTALTEALPEQWSILAETVADDEDSKGRRSGRRGSRGGQRQGGPPRRELSVVRGRSVLTETVAGTDYRVGADGFWQVHRDAPELLSGRVTAALGGSPRSLTDLYCGVGLLGLEAARATGAHLFGVEGVGPAIEHARSNAAGVDAEFLTLGVEKARLPESDAIILDPPRAGAGKAVTKSLVESTAATIVYVSCDAGTLARDLAALSAGGFAIESLEGFDLFPLTAHVETVTVLRR